MKKKAFLVMASALVLTACGGGSTSSETAAETTAATEAATEATSEAQTEEETTAEETEAPEAAIEMGTAGTVGEWEITISDMEIVDEIPDGYGTFAPDEGNKYLLASVKGSNLAKQAQTFLSSFPFGDDLTVVLLYGDGYEFVQTNLLGYSESVTDSSVNPLSSKEGKIAFEIPDSVAESSDSLTVHFECDGETLDIKVR